EMLKCRHVPILSVSASLSPGPRLAAADGVPQRTGGIAGRTGITWTSRPLGLLCEEWQLGVPEASAARAVGVRVPLPPPIGGRGTQPPIGGLIVGGRADADAAGTGGASGIPAGRQPAGTM